MSNTNESIGESEASDFVCKVIQIDRRMHQSQENFKEKRKDGNCYVIESTIDQFIKHQEQNIAQHRDDIRFAHNKKFIILGSTFTILALITTVFISLIEKLDMSTITTSVVSTLFVLIISAVNFSITKYLLDLKLAQIRALRGLNCSRQSLHAVLFAKLEGKLPKKLPRNGDQAYLPGTILDKSTKFWEVYGRHEKYPLHNAELRGRYLDSVKIDSNGVTKFKPKKHLWFKSGDIFPIYMLAIITLITIMSPVIIFLIEEKNFELFYFIIIILIFGWCFFMFFKIKSMVDDTLEQIVSKLQSSGETYPFEEHQGEVN
jgi:hypothetical protein